MRERWHVQRIAKQHGGRRLYYHVTFASRVKKILYEGIKTGKRRNWKTLITGSSLGTKGLIYCFRTWEGAYRWAMKQAYDFKRPTAIIVFREHYSRVKKLPDSIMSALYGDEYVVSTNIKPEQIKDVVIVE